MITLTRLNGATFALNPDLIERAEATPDTVLTLVDGTKYVVAESVPEIISKVRHLRASILAQAANFDVEAEQDRGYDDDERPVTPVGVIPFKRG